MFALYILGPPGKPMVEIRDQNSTGSARVSWWLKSTGGYPITNYTLQLSSVALDEDHVSHQHRVFLVVLYPKQVSLKPCFPPAQGLPCGPIPNTGQSQTMSPTSTGPSLWSYTQHRSVSNHVSHQHRAFLVVLYPTQVSLKPCLPPAQGLPCGPIPNTGQSQTMSPTSTGPSLWSYTQHRSVSNHVSHQHRAFLVVLYPTQVSLKPCLPPAQGLPCGPIPNTGQSQTMFPTSTGPSLWSYTQHRSVSNHVSHQHRAFLVVLYPTQVSLKPCLPPAQGLPCGPIPNTGQSQTMSPTSTGPSLWSYTQHRSVSNHVSHQHRVFLVVLYPTQVSLKPCFPPAQGLPCGPIPNTGQSQTMSPTSTGPSLWSYTQHRSVSNHVSHQHRAFLVVLYPTQVSLKPCLPPAQGLPCGPIPNTGQSQTMSPTSTGPSLWSYTQHRSVSNHVSHQHRAFLVVLYPTQVSLKPCFPPAQGLPCGPIPNTGQSQTMFPTSTGPSLWSYTQHRSVSNHVSHQHRAFLVVLYPTQVSLKPCLPPAQGLPCGPIPNTGQSQTMSPTSTGSSLWSYTQHRSVSNHVSHQHRVFLVVLYPTQVSLKLRFFIS